MSAPTWLQMWTSWFNAYRDTRVSSTPIGYYDLHDMRAAFDAGARADHQRGLEIIVDRIRQAVAEADGGQAGN